MAGNIGYGNDVYNWSDSTITFGGSNIVQGLISDGTVVGSSSILAVNPLLGPLTNNGGHTLSQLLEGGSPISTRRSKQCRGGPGHQSTRPAAPVRLQRRGHRCGGNTWAAESPYYPPAIIVTTTADSGPNSLARRGRQCALWRHHYFCSRPLGSDDPADQRRSVLTNTVTIDASALANGISIDGNANDRIFEADNGVNVLLNALTITNGYVDGDSGGAILGYYGNLTLNNCKLLGNRCVHGTAGALATVGGSLMMTATTVSSNTCDNTSAIYVEDQPANIVGCTISGNSGSVGDALRFAADDNNSALSVVNSTFSGNLVTGDSGFGAAAITLQAPPPFTATAGLTNCTIVINTVVQESMAGAIYLDPSSGTNTVTLYNSIVSGNTSGGVAADISTNVTPNSSFNLIGVGGGLVNGVNGNKVGINDPLVAALGNYGGGMQTMPPLPGSPAIDAGGASYLRRIRAVPCACSVVLWTLGRWNCNPTPGLLLTSSPARSPARGWICKALFSMPSISAPTARPG